MTEWPAVVSQAGPAQRGGLGLARPRVRSRARPCGHSLARVPGPETRAREAPGCPRAGCLRRREGRAAELRLRDELRGRVDVPFGAPGPRGLGGGGSHGESHRGCVVRSPPLAPRSGWTRFGGPSGPVKRSPGRRWQGARRV